MSTVLLLLAGSCCHAGPGAPPHGLLGSPTPVAPSTVLRETPPGNWTRAEWIGGETQLRREFDLGPGAARGAASLFVASLGCHEAFLNGRRLGASVLEPGFSTVYPARVLYVAHNVSALLRPGANVLGVRLGACKYGWQQTYCALGQRRCAAVKLELLTPAGEVALHSEPASGHWRATRGPYAPDGARYPNRSLFDGVRYDQAQDRGPGWCTPAGADAGWGAAVKITPPWGDAGTVQLEPHAMPPVTAHPPEGIAPVTVRAVAPGSDIFVADFGRNMAGFVSVAVPPTRPLPGAGARLLVEVEHTELLTAAGGRASNQFASPPHSVHDCQHYGSCALQTDRYVVTDLSAGLLLSPGTFSYKGFRYVEVRGLPNLTAASLRAYPVHSDVRPTASFHCNRSVLNRLDAAIAPTVLSNLVSIPTDCPTREKRGWMGDGQWSAENNAARWDMRLLYRNWVQSMVDTQSTGCSHATAAEPPPAHCLSSNLSLALSGHDLRESAHGSHQRPVCAICCDETVTNAQRFGCYSKNGSRGVDLSDSAGAVPGVVPFDVVGGWPADPGYSAAIVTVPHALWKRSGDLLTAEQSFGGMRAYAEHLLRHTTDGLVQFGMLGDWLALEQTDVPRVSAFSGALSVQMVAEMARALGRGADAARFAAAARAMRERYHARFYLPQVGAYGSACAQTANALPLVLGCVPSQALANVSRALADSVSPRCTGLPEPTLLTGGVGTRYVWAALALIGREDLALALALKTTAPSLGWMIDQGPGTFWEDWAGREFTAPRGSSKNHHMLTGGLGLFLLDVVAGLRAEHDERGRATLTARLALPVVRAVGGARAAVESAAGRATLEWAFAEKVEGGRGASGRLTVAASVPASARAFILELPPPTAGAVLREAGVVAWRSGKARLGGLGGGGAGVRAWGGHAEAGLFVELAAGRHSLEYEF
jgi:hypothetical protein